MVPTLPSTASRILVSCHAELPQVLVREREVQLYSVLQKNRGNGSVINFEIHQCEKNHDAQIPPCQPAPTLPLQFGNNDQTEQTRVYLAGFAFG